MTEIWDTERELLEATARDLTAKGYDVVIEPSPNLLPAALSIFRPDAIALGREPKLIVEIASEGAIAAAKVARLQEALAQNPEWKLHLVISRVKRTSLSVMPNELIAPTLDSAKKVAQIEPRAALLLGWSAFEAVSRARRPSVFSRPQSPGRIIERLAAEGVLTPTDAAFLREMAHARNAFIHGDLTQTVDLSQVERFLSTIECLLSAAPWSTLTPE
ncbi:hypothetical protein CDQ92_18285 [Sphingopyxis bauzanensis]|uniref:REase AHJR-like domain-containing protein n=1 Tax=Sphingopyxis bauzanensis TaxID=651663 RepID=A0A246JQ97_9SPHN|nr:hypothetical protein [Sphingopyxis bauzanensis]OWQ94982.1 hypothetical protein CDQ92_18285 [Sphingopyxis bauzanensis]GGJ54520.1 hypothetical protein GCM10011393_25950 [Sphingopyxis bauzanensis]